MHKSAIGHKLRAQLQKHNSLETERKRKRSRMNNVLSVIPFHGCLLETEGLLCRMEEIRAKVSDILLPISCTFNVADIRDNKP